MTGKCTICHRTLKNPKWAAIGVGPVCARKNGLSFVIHAKRADEKNHFYDAFGGTEDVVAERVETGRIKTNVEQVWELHSPDGFEMGYGGSGPADFALNILLKFGCSRQEADVLHHEFKWKFVATLDHRVGGRIPAREIYDWLDEQRGDS